MKIKRILPDWVIGLLVTLFFLFITFTGILDFTHPIEMKTFDLRARLAAPAERNPDIELVVITDDDLNELGRFPWPRHVLAQAVENLALAGAKVIALNILFAEPEESAGLTAVRKLKETYEGAGLAQAGAGLDFYKMLSKTLEELDNDAKLYNALKKAGNVVLPVYFDTQSTGRDQEAPDFIARHAYKRVEGKDQEWAVSSLIWLSKIKPLLPSFGEVAAGIGHMNSFPDPDGYIRNQVHVVGYLNDYYFPSFAMAIAKLFKGVEDEEVTLVLGEGVYLKVSPSSVIQVPVVDPQMHTLLCWNQGPGVAFHQTPFVKVLKNQVKTSLFRDKIVIIGPVAPGIGDRHVTPISGNLPGVEVVANAVANILNQRFFLQPAWVLFLEFAVLLFFGLYITLVLPRLRAGTGAAVTLILLLGYGVAGTVLFFSSHIWVRVAPPILLLIIGYILVVSKRFLITERTKEKVEADSVETNKMLGLSFQQQGMLDLAMEKFRSLPIEEEGVKDLLYNLGLDYERKRQFSKALAAYKMIVADGVNFKDLDERIPKLKHAEATMIFGGPGTAHPGDIGDTLLDLDTKPTLGRYEVVGELGRGAMGIVYRGTDPKINRTVAIKTVRLSDFDEEILDEMKSRFFREAESAGLLTHPNIVTIYDCGEEHDLAYIAMEYLDGEDLEKYTHPDNLLPMRETLSIVAKVAEALDYAHGKDIVHRDIKPANIMRLKENNEIKVTDFGIARITSSSKTKTGVVLGTPSYMSPEQVSGKKVDGRSDIFSLGVVLFEMLTGQKPFRGEDITTLMYHIAKERHPSIRSVNPKVPPVVEKIIDKALEKDLDHRYQRAGQMARHLNMVIAKIDEIRARKKAEQEG
ncbi:MAG: CHASE2 domain-containing protein [Deltaproteobacteria bacterium]|nr:CHASE2 domain-containing protein [Deltaproteobacteria bacterium]MBW1923196.1 CHASE2 domain-containing protein [Deltaproteobacteria bacterium]MBW1948281.1 CHASE2 domain-containing protein [Deltaproteobacteria bacterium]MBW2006778.1 CHASE2 domain-containing protein [Deltaproteobacteria bacterium]MBW2347804.1 CHASE2 domain-containing protein [Deltaproteobacteria bacterium]